MLADEPELPLVGRDHAAHQQVVGGHDHPVALQFPERLIWPRHDLACVSAAHDSSCLAKMVRAAARRSDGVDRTPRWRKSHMIRLPIAQSSARLSTWCAHMSPAPDVGYPHWTQRLMAAQSSF